MLTLMQHHGIIILHRENASTSTIGLWKIVHSGPFCPITMAVILDLTYVLVYLFLAL